MVGSQVSDIIEVDDDYSPSEIEEMAREAMFNMIEWEWKELD